MKQPGNTAEELLDVAFAPEAEALLDELERSGQFRIGVEAELDEPDAGGAASNDYSLARGTGSVTVQNWWTTGRVVLLVAAGIRSEDLVLARVNDSLVVHTRDALDRVTFDGYLGLIPDASTLRIIFSDGGGGAPQEVRSRITAGGAAVAPAPGN